MKHRQGYTLLELLIVLAVLAAIAALMIPAVRGPLDKSRLTSAAQQVQATIAKTRAFAVREGVAVQLRYRIHGQQMVIERVPMSLTSELPLQIDDGSNSNSGNTSAVPSPSVDLAGAEITTSENTTSENTKATASDSGNNPVRLRESELPSGVTFADFSVSNSPSSVDGMLPNSVPGMSPNETTDLLTEQGASDWSVPIVFQPDGRTRNTTLRLNGQRDFYIEVTLRGLTGTARYTAPQRDTRSLAQRDTQPTEMLPAEANP
ncbi:MAG: prepilin-type N-terminal cleavage/methylation domain-containing protein [Planctomyces sp.]|nr:prepilin-type N-terminal cleavage/methylation domain-containing protein [Planctomyces sp.]